MTSRSLTSIAKIVGIVESTHILDICEALHDAELTRDFIANLRFDELKSYVFTEGLSFTLALCQARLSSLIGEVSGNVEFNALRRLVNGVVLTSELRSAAENFAQIARIQNWLKRKLMELLAETANLGVIVRSTLVLLNLLSYKDVMQNGRIIQALDKLLQHHGAGDIATLLSKLGAFLLTLAALDFSSVGPLLRYFITNILHYLSNMMPSLRG